MPKQLFQVRYEWPDAKGRRCESRTVVTSLSQGEAEARFQRQNTHVRVVPAESALSFQPSTAASRRTRQ